MYCKKCGNELENDVNFCSKCGTNTNSKNNERNIHYDGEIHKCPNCGEVVNSFEIKCSACGFELRNTSTTTSIHDFSKKLEDTNNDYQKANIIRNFPIPNNKEDIFEFLILASSNIDENPNKEVFNAWISKIEQCYQKAKISFKQENDFIKIQAIYEKTSKNIKKIRRSGPVRKILTILVPILVFIILNVAFWSWIASSYPNEQEEVARLEAVVIEIERALENKEYELAMMHAKSIDYSAWTADEELERQWDIKREYLIGKIIKEAEKDGIKLEYPSETADEKYKTSNSYNYNTQYRCLSN